MKSAALLRQQIETILSRHMPGALSPRAHTEPERASSSIDALDDLLLGGLPAGCLTEFFGPESSGRTTAALTLLANITQDGRVAAWIDVSDTLSPEAAAANGVDLQRLLWVRCGAPFAADIPRIGDPSEAGMRLPPKAASSGPPVRGGSSPHPRSESHGMPQAISGLLEAQPLAAALRNKRRDRITGTPGAPNRPLTFRSSDREEQVASDRRPARRGEELAVAIVPQSGRNNPLHRLEVPELSKHRAITQGTAAKGALPWDLIDQAMRTADLLLQAGGFSVIVLDLGSTPAAMAWRIPLATWFRFRAACERSRVSLLLLTQHPCARSSAELVLRMASGRMEAGNKVMTGIVYSAERERQRHSGADRFDSHQRQPHTEKIVSIRKPPQPEHGSGAQWTANSAWRAER